MEKDIKILEKYLDKQDGKMVSVNRLEFLEAIENLLTKHKELEKENQKLKQQNTELKKNTISKNKIRNAIEQLKPYIYVGENAPQDFLQYKVKAKIQILEELLQENSNIH